MAWGLIDDRTKGGTKMNEPLTVLITLTQVTIFFIVSLYAIAEFVVSGFKTPRVEIVVLAIIFLFFVSLEYLLNSCTAWNATNWVFNVLTITMAVFLYYFRREVLKTFREAAGTLNYLKEIIRYKLGN